MQVQTKLIKVDSIIVNDRIRKELGNIEALANNIKENGLINPILVTKDYELIAGERRYSAIKLLGWEEVEVRIMTVHDAFHKIKLEISENEYRKDFTFREKVEWTKMLEREYKKKSKKKCLMVEKVLRHLKTLIVPNLSQKKLVLEVLIHTIRLNLSMKMLMTILLIT
ncbi:ParB N-terminal domain-containing protein [Niameybacter massiliensis]|uniref:ParB N-terminal domain-containing protein n=1 Tax=Holtiella tumoricola TaxID=3018743 RepID=A0AA42DMJ3_9FIRM|nr:ParB N-terminal domain-containing protein [Holtiella tumoricola]MDA3731428.1 ParB N-terminal domain-containing protein [Holtiella tumoricola]